MFKSLGIRCRRHTCKVVLITSLVWCFLDLVILLNYSDCSNGIGKWNDKDWWIKNYTNLEFIIYISTVRGHKCSSLALFWSKTTLNTDCMSGIWVDPTSCNMGSFFLRSLALSVPIYRNFQSNGAKWRSIKLWKKNLYNSYIYLH